MNVAYLAVLAGCVAIGAVIHTIIGAAVVSGMILLFGHCGALVLFG